MKFLKRLIALTVLIPFAAYAQVVVPGNGAAGVNGATGKTLTFNNTLTFSGTDGTTFTFPSATDTVAGLAATNAFTGTNSFSSSLTITTAGTLTGTGTVTLASAGAITENAALTFGASSTIADGAIPFSNSLTGNPLTQTTFRSFTAASVSAGINILNSATTRTIFPGNGTVMVSGSSTGATSLVIECSPSGNVITTIPVSALIDGRPIPFTYTSSATAAAATPAKALVAGCSSADAVMISAPGLATTTQVFVNMPYIPQNL